MYEVDGGERRALRSAFNLPASRLMYPSPRRTTFSTAAAVSGQYTRTRRAPEQQARVEIRLPNHGRLPADKIWRVRRCMAMVVLHGARMCDASEGSVRFELEKLNSGRGSRMKGGCLLNISTAPSRVFYALRRVYRPEDRRKVFRMECREIV